MRNYISLLLLLVLCVQVLPVKEIGSVLFSNQINEELAHSCDDAGKDGKSKTIDFKSEMTSPSLCNMIFSGSLSGLGYIFHSSTLPPNHSGEISTPPPNCVIC